MNIKTLHNALKTSWNKDTCYRPMRDKWKKSNPAYGQCYTTALVVNDYFGGKILKAKFKDGTGHFWNLINKKEVDLTKSQFNKNEKFPKPITFPRSEIAKKYKKYNRQYRLLKKKVQKILRNKSYYIIIRGAAGCGKTTIAKKLAENLGALYVSFDVVLEKHNLDRIKHGRIPNRNFIKANEIIIPKARKTLENGKVVIFDGCFYSKEQLTHLLQKLSDENYIFTLKTSLRDCQKRNKLRKKPLDDEAIEQVYKLVSKLSFGIKIYTAEKPIPKIIKEIKHYLNKAFFSATKK